MPMLGMWRFTYPDGRIEWNCRCPTTAVALTHALFLQAIWELASCANAWKRSVAYSQLRLNQVVDPACGSFGTLRQQLSGICRGWSEDFVYAACLRPMAEKR